MLLGHEGPSVISDLRVGGDLGHAMDVEKSSSDKMNV